METNFRSQQAVTEAAASLISHNSNRVEKAVRSSRPVSIKPIYKRLKTEEEEASYVASKVKELIASGKCMPSDIAILCRTNKQMDPIKAALDRLNIQSDTCELDENGQYSRFISVLQSVSDMNSLSDLAEALNFPDNCFNKFNYEEAKEAYAQARSLDLRNLNYTDTEWLELLAASDESFENSDIFRERYALIKALHNAPRQSAAEAAEKYKVYMEEAGYSSEYPEDYHFVLQVLDIAENYEEAFGIVPMKDFICHLSISIGLGDTVSGSGLSAVNLLTMHRSKGLEFKAVFIIGLQVGIFPNDYFIYSEADLEAERRLLYVGITRAEELLFISSYKDPLGGAWKNYFVKHGFLAEIPKAVFAGEEEFKKALEMLPEITEAAPPCEPAAEAPILSKAEEGSLALKGSVSPKAAENTLPKEPTPDTKELSLTEFYSAEDIEGMPLSDFVQFFNRASECRQTADTGLQAKELAKAVASLIVTLEKNPGEAELLRKICDYYIPDAARLFLEYAGHKDGEVSEEILAPVRERIAGSYEKLARAVRERIDDVNRIAVMDTHARADALSRLITRDGLALDDLSISDAKT